MAYSNPGKVYVMQTSFAGGEVSPDIWARSDFDKYAVSARTMENFYPHLYGGASNRQGTYCIAEVKDSSKKTRVMPFQFSVEQAYVQEVGNTYMRPYKDGGQITRGASNTDAWVTSTAYVLDDAVIHNSLVYRCILAHTSGASTEPGIGASWATNWVQSNIVEITTDFLEADIFDLKSAQSADIMYLCHPSYAPATLTRSSHYDWTFADFDFENGPFRTQNTTSTTIAASAVTGSVNLTASAAVFSAGHIGSLFQVSHDMASQAIAISFSTNGPSSSVLCKGSWTLITRGTWTGKLSVEISEDNGTTWKAIRNYSSNNDNNVSDEGVQEDIALIRVTMSNYSSGTCTVDFTAFAFTVNGVVAITAVTDSTHAAGTVTNRLGATTATTLWAEGAWSIIHGYPRCTKFYQNRLGFAGSNSDPLTMWFSQSGDYPSFLTSTPSEDDDALTYPLVSQGVNTIRSMVPMGDMLAFTSGGVWKAGGGESTAITPNNFRAVQQEYGGSSNLEPLVVKNRILYCQEMGSTIADIGYSLQDDSYVGDDLTVIARHMFRGYEIVDWAYQREPDSIIWVVRDDGVLLSFTYNKAQKVWAWARHTTEGYFESVCTIPGDGYDEVWFVVRRIIGGTTKRFIERLAQRMASDDPKDQFFVDSGLTYDVPKTITGATKANPVVITSASHGFSNGDLVDISGIVGMTELNGNRYKAASVTTDAFALTNMDDDSNINGTAYTTYNSGGYARKAVTTISGLDHLEGEAVAVLADGNVVTGKTVSSGAITLTTPASRVHVGLPYTCNLETLNFDFPLKDGTIQGRPKRVAAVTVRFENTMGGGSLAINDGTLSPIDSSMSNAALFTGDKKKVPLATAPANEARIKIQQSAPLPMTVLALIAEVSLDGGT